MINKPLVVISGPTASGKTGTSIYLAKEIDAEIINFDSLLFYKEITIGTAKPTHEEREGVVHHLIDIASISTPLNASRFINEAIEIIHDCHKRNVTPILVGGSGFYLRALIKGMYESPTTDVAIKKECEELFEKEGIQPFRDFLKRHDIKSFEKIHENDHYRTIRAVEHFKSTGTPFSEEAQKITDPYDFSTCQFPDWNIHHIYLDLPKENHWEIIKERANTMLQNGLIQEIKELLGQGFTGNEKPLESIGYKETQLFLKGDLATQEDLLERIYISTRQLAKSQRTFFKKMKPKHEYHPLNDKIQILNDTIEFLKNENTK